jgi:hypothetical protein
VIFDQKIAVFTPDTAISQKSFHLTYKKPAIAPKIQRYQLKGANEMKELQRISSSLESLHRSYESSLNKTAEIVHKKEDTFLNRIAILFEEDGNFKLKH